MTAAAALAALLLAAGPGRADDAPVPPLPDLAPARAAPGWTRQANSLLLYGEDGALQQEIPLREPDPLGAVTEETRGGSSPDGRLAWTLERRRVWSPGRAKLLESQRTFRVYGASGRELWRDDAVDVPERGEPVLFSGDGETLLLARRTDAGWTAEARTWLGRTIAAVGPFPRLVATALTRGGRYALARWRVPDKSDTHTFLDLSTGERKDVPSSDLILGLARVDDDGVVRSGPRTIFSFAASTAVAAVPASTASAVAPASAPR